jgi:hypothetical protein
VYLYKITLLEASAVFAGERWKIWKRGRMEEGEDRETGDWKLVTGGAGPSPGGLGRLAFTSKDRER